MYFGQLVTHIEADVEAVKSRTCYSHPTPDRHAASRVQCDVMGQCAQAQWRFFRFEASPDAMKRQPSVR